MWAAADPLCTRSRGALVLSRPALYMGQSRPVAAGFELARVSAHPEHVESTMAENKERPHKVVADNRKARFNYEIGEVVEAGIALTGTEVKSLRTGRATIAEAYADAKNGEIWLINANIPEYLQSASFFNHAPKRPRKLLLHKRQIHKLAIAVEREGMTLVPLRLFFNEKGRAKIDIALGRGKKLHDKRETEKKRSWDREKGRLLRSSVKG
jgi:SsrA-binding protein